MGGVFQLFFRRRIFFVANVAAVQFGPQASRGAFSGEDGIEHLERATEFFGKRRLLF